MSCLFDQEFSAGSVRFHLAFSIPARNDTISHIESWIKCEELGTWEGIFLHVEAKSKCRPPFDIFENG